MTGITRPGNSQPTRLVQNFYCHNGRPSLLPELWSSDGPFPGVRFTHPRLLASAPLGPRKAFSLYSISGTVHADESNSKKFSEIGCDVTTRSITRAGKMVTGPNGASLGTK